MREHVVRFGDEANEYHFDRRPWPTHVRAVCHLFGRDYDEDDNYYVLTQGGTDGTARVLRRLPQLAAASEGAPPVCLRLAADLARERLSALRDATAYQVMERLQSLLELIRGDVVMSNIVIEENGMQCVLAASGLAAATDVRHVELAMACLCELFQIEAAQAWLEEHQEEELHPALFRRLFAAIFRAEATRLEGICPPLACLSACLYLIQETDCAAAAAHAAAKGSSIDDARSGGSHQFFEPFYQQIVAAADTDGDEGETFQTVAASLLLAGMAEATSEDHSLRADVLREVQERAANGGEAMRAFSESDSANVMTESLLSSFMYTCTELAMASSGARKQDELLQRLSQLERKVQQLQEANAKLTKEVRQRHQIMCKMVGFIRIENDGVVEQSLEGIIRYGWDSLNWKAGYTMLHYVAECVEDPSVVELVGLLANNVDAADDHNMRPIDYARHRKADAIVRTIQKLRRSAKKNQLEEGEKQDERLASPKEAKAAALDRLARLEGLPPKLRHAIEAVVEKGWAVAARSFQGGHSPPHEAAKCGHVEALNFLVDLGANLQEADSYGLTPMDYAVQGGHEKAIVAIKEHVASQVGAKRQEKATSKEAAVAAEPEAASTALPIPRRKPLPKAEPTAERRAQLPVPSVERPELRRALEVVARKPWSKIRWPHNFTALHLAAQLGSSEVVEFLLEATAAPSLQTQDERGRTPLDIAKKHGFSALEELLAPPTSPSRGSRTSALSFGIGGLSPPSATPTSGNAVSSMAEPKKASPNKYTHWDPFKKQWAAGKMATRWTGERYVDVLREVLRIRDRNPDDLGLLELRGEVARLRAENSAWLSERKAGVGPGGSAEAHGAAAARGFGLTGPLDERQLVKYMKQVDMFGREKVLSKLEDSPNVGGMALDSAKALKAMEQIEMAIRLCESRTKDTFEDNSVETAEPDPVPPEEAAAAAHAGSGGRSQPGPQDAAAAAPEAAPASAPAPSKGPGKGKKGPPPPKAGGATPAAEVAPAAGPAKGPPAKGGKGGGPPGAKAKGAKGGSKAGAAAVELKKPKVEPAKPMKPLWWTRLNFGAQLKQGETVWDEVSDLSDMLPIDELVERFAKTAPAAKPKVQEAVGEKKKKIQYIEVITDPKARQNKELALNKCPPAPEVGKLIEELDDELDIEHLKILIENGCPAPDEFGRLAEERKKLPDVPFALIEQYMWVIGQLPASKQRMELWHFVRTYKEQEEQFRANLSDFRDVVRAFGEAEALHTVLGLTLAVGNYLNGGTNRGQADGFDLEALEKIESIKDPEGNDIRSFIFRVLFEEMAEKAAEFVEEMNPLFMNVSRRLAKDSSGTEKLSKSARITYEDFDNCVKVLEQEFNKQNEIMTMILQHCEDPADPFRLRMPQEFAEAKSSIESLVKLKDEVKQHYTELLKYFNVKSMKSSDFCLLWDNFLIPPDLIINTDADMKKKFMEPAFCRGKPLNVGQLEVLWKFKEPAQAMKAAHQAPKKRHGKRPNRFARKATKSGTRTLDADGGGRHSTSGAAPPSGGVALPKLGGKGGPPKGKGKGPPATKAAAPAPGGGAAPVDEAAAVQEAPPSAPTPKPPSAKGKGKGPPAPPAAKAAAPEPAGELAPATAEEAPGSALESPPPAPTPKPSPTKGNGKAKGPPPPRAAQPQGPAAAGP